MLILWISWKKPSCSQNFEEETATKTSAPLQMRTLSAQEIIYARVHACCLAQSSRALFPKTPKTRFFFPPRCDITKWSLLRKYLFSSVAFFGVAFAISEVLHYKTRWAKAFASNLIPRALFLQFSCNITFWEESGFVAMGALITRATDPRFRENK